MSWVPSAVLPTPHDWLRFRCPAARWDEFLRLTAVDIGSGHKVERAEEEAVEAGEEEGRVRMWMS